MMRFAIALVACAVVGCGVGEGGSDGQSVEDFVDPELLAQAQTEWQRACLIGASITMARADECSVPVGQDASTLPRCLDLEGPIPESFKEQSECFPHWAFATCDELRGAEGDPCVLVLER